MKIFILMISLIVTMTSYANDGVQCSSYNFDFDINLDSSGRLVGSFSGADNSVPYVGELTCTFDRPDKMRTLYSCSSNDQTIEVYVESMIGTTLISVVPSGNLGNVVVSPCF